MLAAIRAALETLTRSTGKVYGLTAALPCAPSNIENLEVGKLTTLLTEVSSLIHVPKNLFLILYFSGTTICLIDHYHL